MRVLIGITAGPDGVLTIKADRREMGSQYDHHARTLVFSRPEDLAEHDLSLLFSSRRFHSLTFEPVFLGRNNEFPVPNFLTLGEELNLQIVLEKDDRREFSNELHFALRPSIPSGETIKFPESGAAGCQRLEENAMTDVELDMEAGVAVFKNLAGETRGTVPLGGGAGGMIDCGGAAEMASDMLLDCGNAATF